MSVSCVDFIGEMHLYVKHQPSLLLFPGLIFLQGILTPPTLAICLFVCLFIFSLLDFMDNGFV